MSTQPPDGRLPDDELASAYLDGEATADERALVEGDDGLRRRVEELRAVREALRAPVDQPGSDDLERLIAVAVGAAPAPASAPTDELAARRTARSLPPWLSVAALVLALLLAVPLLASVAGDDGDREDETAASIAADDAGGGDAAEGDAAGAAEESAPLAGSAAAPTDVGDLGTIADEDALRAAVGPALGTATLSGPAPAVGDAAQDGGGESGEQDHVTRESTTAFAQATPCAQADLGTPTFQATARYEGVDAVVLAFVADDGTRVRVLAADNCRLLADVTL